MPKEPWKRDLWHSQKSPTDVLLCSQPCSTPLSYTTTATVVTVVTVTGSHPTPPTALLLSARSATVVTVVTVTGSHLTPPTALLLSARSSLEDRKEGGERWRKKKTKKESRERRGRGRGCQEKGRRASVGTSCGRFSDWCSLPGCCFC